MPLTLPHFVTKSLNNPANCTCYYLLFPRVFSLWGLSYHFKHICVRFCFLWFWHRNKRSFLGIINLGLCCIHRLCPSLHVLCNLRHKEFGENKLLGYYKKIRDFCDQLTRRESIFLSKQYPRWNHITKTINWTKSTSFIVLTL